MKNLENEQKGKGILQRAKDKQAVKWGKIFPILLIGFILFVAIALGSLIGGVNEQKKEQSVLLLEEKEKLQNMSNYLDEIGTAVSENKECLTESVLFQTDTKQALVTVQENLLVLEEELSQIENVMQKYINTDQIINSEVTKNLTKLDECHQDIKTQITSAHGGITEILSVISQDNEVKFAGVFDKMTHLQNQLEYTQKGIKTYYKEVYDFLDMLKKGNENDFASTFEKIEKIQQKIKKSQETEEKQYNYLVEFLGVLKEETKHDAVISFEKLEQLKEELWKEQKINKENYDELTVFLEEIKQENAAQKEELAKQLVTIQEQMNQLLETELDSLQVQMETDYLALLQEMEQMENQVKSTENSVVELLNLMGESGENQQAEIEAAFTKVNDSIDQIRTEYQNVHANLEKLIRNVQETQLENHEETLTVLAEVETNLEEISMGNLEQISDSLQVIEKTFADSVTRMKQEMNQNITELGTQLNGNFLQANTDLVNKMDAMDHNISTQYEEFHTNVSAWQEELNSDLFARQEELNQNISAWREELNNNISTKYEDLNTNISNQYEQVVNNINDNGGIQQESMDNLMAYLEQKLGQVFTFVSNGKKKVVSALLTKGVSLNEDATFAQICDAVLSIEQEIKIGVEQIPGNIEYEYHYHVNGKGEQLHTDTCKISGKGGCYNDPLYHRHKDGNGNVQRANYTAEEEGGCFTAPVYHKHTGKSSVQGGCYSVADTKVCGEIVCLREYYRGYTCHAACNSFYEEEYGCSECGEITGGRCGGGGNSCGNMWGQVTGNHSTTTYSLGCGKTGKTIEGYSLSCGKDTDTLEGYQANCGLAEGQIIGATIRYDQSVAATK